MDFMVHYMWFFNTRFFSLVMSHYLFALPLILAFSLCYAATRGEHLRDILPRAARWVLGLCLTGAVFFLLLYYITPR